MSLYDIYCPYGGHHGQHDGYGLMSSLDISDGHFNVYEEVECEECEKYYVIELYGEIKWHVQVVGQ